MKDKIRIIPAKRKHRHEMKSVNEICLPENYPMDYWEENLKAKNSFVLCANSQVIGYILTNHEPSIASFAVLEQYRNKGYGKQLILTCLQELEKKGYNKVTLHVHVDNQIAFNLYKSAGFTITETLPNYYGDGQNGHLMTLTDFHSSQTVSSPQMVPS